MKLDWKVLVDQVRKRVSTYMVIMVLVIIAFDQASKIYAEKAWLISDDPSDSRNYRGALVILFELGERPKSVEEATNFYVSFGFNYVRNLGSAWGFLSDLDPKFRIPFFYFVNLVAVVGIFLFLTSLPEKQILPRYALFLVLAGALGNCIDRIRIGYVIDFIHVDWSLFGWYYNFPRFNIADSSIFCGVWTLVIYLLFIESKMKKNVSEEK